MTVLVVDDEPTVRQWLIRSIAAAGYYVLEAASSVEAARLAGTFSGPIHLAVIDQTLEDHHKGMELAAEIAAVQPGVHVLLISGMPEQHVPAGLPRSKLTLEFLQKPFTHRTLLDRIQQMLSHYNRCW
jgi:two-component system cell cycle sensor histidine kinase/response regulator CckA